MKVSALIKKLMKLPPDADIAFYNTPSYNEGTYKATGIDFYEQENIVTIETDYKRIMGDNGKWE